MGEKTIPWTCPQCGGVSMRSPSNIRRHAKTGVCRQCSLRIYGPDHPRWKGGEFFSKSHGRWMVTRQGSHMLRYRAVMEDHLGRRLSPDEAVHHINGDCTDDRLENLRLVSFASHREFHGGLGAKQRELIYRLRSEGLTQREIAERVGVSQTTVSRNLRKAA